MNIWVFRVLGNLQCTPHAFLLSSDAAGAETARKVPEGRELPEVFGVSEALPAAAARRFPGL